MEFSFSQFNVILNSDSLVYLQNKGFFELDLTWPCQSKGLNSLDLWEVNIQDLNSLVLVGWWLLGGLVLLGVLELTWCWERRLCSALCWCLWGCPKGLAWWLSPALSDCSWDRSTDKLPVPQVLYLSAETEGPEEIASAATHCKMFVLCY